MSIATNPRAPRQLEPTSAKGLVDSRKILSDLLRGEVCVISFDNISVGPEKDISASVISALNFARLTFSIEGSVQVFSKLVEMMCASQTIEKAIEICRDLPDDVHLEVEDVYRVPVFEGSLKLISTNYGSPDPHHITTLLENLGSLHSSAALLLVRYPDVVVCLRLLTSAQDVFVIFNPRGPSRGKGSASLIFSMSIQQIVEQLSSVFPSGTYNAAQNNLDWQARLFEKCSGYVFAPRSTALYCAKPEESLIVSSLTLLRLRAELEDVTRQNNQLKAQSRRLEESIVGLERQLEEERLKTELARSRPATAETSHHDLPTEHMRDHHVKATSSSTRKSAVAPVHTKPLRFSADGPENDPSLDLALRMQAAFDSENVMLSSQKDQLLRTAQRQYHCGICLDDFPEDDAVHIDSCGHELCRDCARGHVCAKIDEHRFPVLCPVCMADHTNNNPGIISGELVPLLGVSEKQYETWVEMEIAQFSILVNCRKCKNSGFIDKHDLEGTEEIGCPFPGCDHMWCRKCQQSIVTGGPKHSCDGTSELDHLMKQQGWRYCPNCKTPIQKQSGCNHLSCIAPGCNTHFCYRCGATINRTAIPREIMEGKTAHFRTCAIY